MDDRVREFVQGIAHNIADLDVALFYQANPTTFDTATGIALRTHRSVTEVEPILARLARHGILEEHVRGEGRYVCYALSRARAVWELLCLLSEAYHDDPEARKEIVRIIIATTQAQKR